MKTLIFKEGQPYLIEDLMSIFKLYDLENINILLSKLINVGILRTSKTYSDIETLLSETTIEENDVKREPFYFFKYVGAAQIKDSYTILVYPKYVDTEKINKEKKNNYSKFKLIMDVIERYDRKKIQNLSTVPDLINNEEDILGIKLSILKDFYENGLFHKEKEEIYLNGEGRILWHQTVNRSEAFILNNIPFYLDFYTNTFTVEQKNIVKFIQSIIITEICRDLDFILDILGMEKVNLVDYELEEIGSNELILDLLEKELNVEFVTKKQNTIKALIKYINKHVNAHDEGITIVGTSEFNLVWEDICSHVYGNNLNNTFGEIGINAPLPLKSNDVLKKFIEKPKWDILGLGEIVSSSTLKLDVLSINNKNINIYDAKYYNIQFEKNKVVGQPGISDITKQYLYELVFRDVIELNHLKVTNQFILPKDELDEDGKIVAYIKLNVFLKLGLQPIGVVLRDCETMYKRYLYM